MSANTDHCHNQRSSSLVVLCPSKYGCDRFRQIIIDHWERWWDYRDLDPAKPFDKIASVGMVEHVGRSQLAEYFKSALKVLKPDGLFLNHAISAHRLKQEGWLERTFPQAGGFLQKYVFPDGELLNIHEMLASAETSGFKSGSITVFQSLLSNSRQSGAVERTQPVPAQPPYRYQPPTQEWLHMPAGSTHTGSISIGL